MINNDQEYINNLKKWINPDKKIEAIYYIENQ